MKYNLVLAVVLCASGVGMVGRIRADFRRLSNEMRTPLSPTFHVVPRIVGYDSSGKAVALPAGFKKAALLPLHDNDERLQATIWKQFLNSSGDHDGIAVIGVFADGEPPHGTSLDGVPWFRNIAYANYAALAFVADLDRTNEIAIFDNHGIVIRRLRRPTDARQLGTAFL